MYGTVAIADNWTVLVVDGGLSNDRYRNPNSQQFEKIEKPQDKWCYYSTKIVIHGYRNPNSQQFENIKKSYDEWFDYST